MAMAMTVRVGLVRIKILEILRDSDLVDLILGDQSVR